MRTTAWGDRKLLTATLATTALTMLAVTGQTADTAADELSARAKKTSDIVIIINDGPDEGLNDPTPAEPVGGNDEETLGEQRLAVFKAAAKVWERILVSDVPITLEAQFDELFCDDESAVLGSAGPEGVFIDFDGADEDDTIYVAAQANQQAGVDLDPDSADLSATFNSLLGSGPECLGGVPFYLGIDDEPAPERTISLFDTVLHEMAHGLGFVSLVDLETGEKLAGFDDIFSNNLEDQTLGLDWPDLTDEERAASVINTGKLQWTGKSVRNCADEVLEEGVAKDGDVLMYAPNPVETGSSVSHFDPELLPDELMEPTATPTTVLDLTVAAFADMGWPVSKRAKKKLCDDALKRSADLS